MKYAAYDEYRPSGVEWVDVVPLHWDVKAAKFGYSIQLGKMLQPESSSPIDTETPYLKSQHVQWESVRVDDLPLMWASPLELIKYGVQDGDLLVCEGGDVGRAGIIKRTPQGAIVQNALHRVRPRSNHDIRFLMYVLEHASGQSWFDIICNRSTIAHFTGEKFGALRVPEPPFDEQQSIVRFLDAKTAQIDALVEKKRQLVEKLREKRSALIALTVTRGLPPEAAKVVGLEPHPEMKESGVDWLGAVPSHWDVVRVKFVAKVESGHTPSRSEPSYWIDEECVIPWVSLNDSKFLKENDFISETAVKISEEGMRNSSAHLLPAGAVVFTRDATIGLTAITTVPAAVSQHVIAWLPGERVFAKYLLLVFKVMQNYLDSLTFGSTLKTIGMSDIRRIAMPLPSIDEQQAIAKYLDFEVSRIDGLTDQIELAITRLTEYRQALITSAVTGKIDVRELA